MHADALDLDAEFFGMFDVQIIDPPYSPHVHDNCASVGVVGGGLGAHDRDLGFASLSPALMAQIALAAGCVKRWSAIFSDVESAHLWREAVGKQAEYIRPIPWIRWSQPQLSGDRPCTILEIISCFHRQAMGARGGVKPVAKHWSGPGNIMPEVSRELLAGLTDRAMRGQEKHPTEKRLSQMLSLVSWFSDPGESVLDLCAGSGSTGLACALLGRDFVGVELDEAWAIKADRRVKVRNKSDLSPRDQVDAEEWCERVLAEATEQLERPPAPDGSDRNTRERAERRLADVERVMGAL
jgi:site-specific DNA-methyltransferase (adenine-specific)